MQNNNVIYFDSFGVEHIPKEIKAFIINNNNNNIIIIMIMIIIIKILKHIFSEYKHMIE